MQVKTRVYCLAGLLLLVLSAPGCLIISETHVEEGGEQHCYTDCHEYEVCEAYCDPYSCWDDCWMQTSCETICEEGHYVEDNSTTYCYSNLDCDEGQACLSGSCRAADTDDSGTAGLCQACESRHDCVEEDALCLQINYDEESGFAETVCGRPCELNEECPDDFDCLNVSDDSSLSPQCVPSLDSENIRTCSASSDLECVGASDCAVGQSCVNNTCQNPSDAECTSDSECGDNEYCAGYYCEPRCVAGECGEYEMCIDGKCERESYDCVFNAECPDDARCVDGQCAWSCEENDDCGPNERCRQGLCEHIECYQTSDCAAGHICVEASCEQGCEYDSDCSFGYICSGFNYCVADPEVECRSSAECSSDQICNEAGECETPCQCDAQCGTGQICNESNGICEDEETSDAEGIEC